MFWMADASAGKVSSIRTEAILIIMLGLGEHRKKGKLASGASVAGIGTTLRGRSHFSWGTTKQECRHAEEIRLESHPGCLVC